MSYKNMRQMVESKNFDYLTKATSFRCNPSMIDVQYGFNARPIDPEHVKQFKVSIKAGATIPPLIVKSYDDIIFVRDGHHRLQAYKELIEEGEDIKAIYVYEFNGNDADAIALLLTSAQGLPLTPMQAGEQYAKLFKYGWKIGEIANKVGKSSTHVSQMLQLVESDQVIKDMVARKEISATSAITSVRKHGSQAKNRLAEGLQKARLDGKAKATAKSIEGDTPKSLVKSIEIEIESGGKFRADVICPKYAELINYLRSTAK